MRDGQLKNIKGGKFYRSKPFRNSCDELQLRLQGNGEEMFLIKEIYYISMDARGCAAIVQSLRGVLLCARSGLKPSYAKISKN